jgi:hypothetical protein
MHRHLANCLNEVKRRNGSRHGGVVRLENIALIGNTSASMKISKPVRATGE